MRLTRAPNVFSNTFIITCCALVASCMVKNTSSDNTQYLCRESFGQALRSQIESFFVSFLNFLGDTTCTRAFLCFFFNLIKGRFRQSLCCVSSRYRIDMECCCPASHHAYHTYNEGGPSPDQQISSSSTVPNKVSSRLLVAFVFSLIVLFCILLTQVVSAPNARTARCRRTSTISYDTTTTTPRRVKESCSNCCLSNK